MTSAADAATYVFCLVQSARRPSLRGVPRSVPGAGTPRLIQIDRDLWAVVADAPLDRFTGDGLQNALQDVETITRHALAHASVVEFFFRRAPVIPLKIFTLFSADERVREHLSPRRSRLRKLFAELRDQQEWGVRIVAGEKSVEPGLPASGREYLQAKKRLNDRRAAPSRSAIKEADGALKALRRLASKVRMEAFPPTGDGGTSVRGASFLVPVARRNRWNREIARIGAALANRGHRLEMSGPWPPYHFVSR